MKLFLPLILCVLAGCQNRPAVNPAPTLPPPVELPVNLAPPHTVATQVLDRKIRQQAQFIEALLSQNEALTAKLNAPVPSVATPELLPPASVSPEPDRSVPARPAESSVLVPNADGVIDVVTAALAAKSGEAANPFAVRTASADAGKEVTLRVHGIVAGPVACAVINDRLIQAGENIGSLTVEAVEADVVLLRHGGHRLRLPISEHPVRIRLPL